MATDSSNKVPNVPPLRFPEFSGEWKRHRVSDILDFYSTNSLSWEQLDYDADNILNLHYGLIHVGLPTLVNLRNTILPGIKDEHIPKNYELCIAGDVAFADASEDTNDVAKAIEFFDLDNKEIICGLHTIHGRDTHNITVVGFKGYAFSSPTFHNQIRRIAQGTKIYSISSKSFAECFIGIPSKAEQNKIASLLALIDERIATQSKIIDKLQSLMSGIRAKLLSHTFLGDSIKLSELGKLKNGYAFKSSTYIPNGRYNIITIANVSGDRFIVGEYNRIEILPDDIQEHQILSDDNILISLTGNVGRVSLNRGTNNLLNQRVGLFELYNNELHEFVYQSISAQAFENSMRLKAQGAAQMNIGKNDVEDYEIPYTANKRLLDKVSSMLQYIDERIILAETLNVQYKSQKLYLLQQMFI